MSNQKRLRKSVVVPSKARVLITAQGQIDEATMVGMIIIAMVHNEIKSMVSQLGLNEETSTAIANCIVEYAIAGTDEERKQAIKRCFEQAGALSDWRGTAMAEAVQQVLDNAPTSIAGFFDNVAGLQNLMTSLRSFEGAEAEEDYDEYEEEEDDDDDTYLPSQRDFLSAKAKCQPRDAKGRFMSSKPQPNEEWVEPERTDFGDPCLNLLYDLLMG